MKNLELTDQEAVFLEYLIEHELNYLKYGKSYRILTLEEKQKDTLGKDLLERLKNNGN
jgi:hypothetical protein